MSISAAMVKELRERTGSGMMECKKALVEAGGDLDAAIEIMRKAGLAKADKKSSRTAAEGRLAVKLSADGKHAAIAEINCETDFVAKADDFTEFADGVAQTILDSGVASVDALLAAKLPAGGAVDERRRELVAKLGENINVRRFERFDVGAGVAVSYLHGSRIGVLVELTTADQALGKDVAMHIAASKPICVDEGQVPAETIAKEKEIFSAQAEASGKPANIIEKMVEGRIKKFLGEVTLVGQPFVKDPDQTVGALLKSKGSAVVRFVRFEVGEGIEKEESNFAEEVMAQVRGS
ncbi:MAG: elongation factor Ts [Methylococcaceae bacterium]|nr:elongation factor Ts [Methylococcaceae bacterium]